MNILFVVPSFSGGGAERVVSVLASNIADRGIDTSVIVYYKAKVEYNYSNNIHMYNLSGGSETDYKELKMVQKIKKLRTLICRVNPDYIIPFLPQVGFHVWLASFGKKVKIVQTVRNNPRTDPPERSHRIIRNIMLLLSWRNFVQNKEQFDYFPLIIQRKSVILPNPVPDEIFGMKETYSQSVTNIVALGRLSEQKNFAMLISVANKVTEQYPNIKFYIYGEGEKRNELKQEIFRQGLAENVFLMGRTSHPYKVLCSADVFVLTSNYEGMPNALLEAMAIGVPSISTNCPTGPADIIDGENGQMVPINGIDEMADTIISWIENPTSLKEIGEKGISTIENRYGAATIADTFLKEVLLLR